MAERDHIQEGVSLLAEVNELAEVVGMEVGDSFFEDRPRGGREKNQKEKKREEKEDRRWGREEEERKPWKMERAATAWVRYGWSQTEMDRVNSLRKAE